MTGIAIAVGLEGIGILVIMAGLAALGRVTDFSNATLEMVGLGMADLAKP